MWRRGINVGVNSRLRYNIKLWLSIHTSGEKLPPYLRLPEKAIAYSVAIKVGR